jgi:DNA-binding MarR family transcriptional regulator
MTLMPKSEDSQQRAHFHTALDALVQIGWIERWSADGDQITIEWTELGRERRRWLRTIERELLPNWTALETTYAICTRLGGDDPEE